MPRRRNTPRPRWTPGQTRAFEKAHMAGTVEQVSARKVGRSTDAVKRKRDRMGLPKIPADQRQDALPGLDGATTEPDATPNARDDDDHASPCRHRWTACGAAGARMPAAGARLSVHAGARRLRGHARRLLGGGAAVVGRVAGSGGVLAGRRAPVGQIVAVTG